MKKLILTLMLTISVSSCAMSLPDLFRLSSISPAQLVFDITDKDKILIVYDAKSEMIYPVCDFINGKFFIKNQYKDIEMYGQFIHGTLSLAKRQDVSIRDYGSYIAKPGFKRTNEEIFPITSSIQLIVQEMHLNTGLPEEFDHNARTMTLNANKCNSLIWSSLIAILGVGLYLTNHLAY